MNSKSESEIQKECVAWLKLHPKIVFVKESDTKIKLQQRYSRGSGYPDIHGMFKGGQYFCIEFKTTKGIVTPKQSLFLSAVFMHGGAALLARDLKEVKDWIKQYE